MPGCARCHRPAVAILRFTPQYLDWITEHQQDCDNQACMYTDADPDAMRGDAMPVCAPHRDWTLAKAEDESPGLGCDVFVWDEIGPDGQPRRPRDTCRRCGAPVERLAPGYWMDGRGFVGCGPPGQLRMLVHKPRGAPS